MKTVFRSAEIAHIWAHRGAPSGRSPGNLSFDGDAICSYATVIGRRITARGKTAYVLDRASFSNSTAKSQGKVWQAIPDTEKTFLVRIGQRGQSLRFTPAELAAHYEAHAAELAAEMPSRYARIRAEQWQAVTAELEKAADCLAYFGLGVARLQKKIAARKAGDSTAAETLKADRAKREAARIVSEKKEAARIAGKVAEWLAGLPVYPASNWPTVLRVEGGQDDRGAIIQEMVTSKGARVPLEDARRTYRFAMLARAKGWHKNGETHPIGSYQLDAVNENGVVAGCHRVTWAEIERFAAAQGWNAEGAK